MRLRRLSTLAAATMITPVLVTMPAPAQGEPAQKPVETTSTTSALLSPAAPQVGDGEFATKSDLKKAEEHTPDVGSMSSLEVLGATGRQDVPSDLAVIGVTWKGDTPLAVQYRTEGADGWSAWATIDTETSAEGEKASGDARSGSDPIVVTGVKAVQARILGRKGSAPRSPELTVIDPGKGQADANTGTQPGAAQAAAVRPTIHTRREWGADESMRKNDPSYGVVRAAIVHNTAGTNNYTPSQVPAILRGIYAFHTQERGWSDIGYNFLVDKWGRVWEGRYGGMDRAVVGAQASGFNETSMGISLMGDYVHAEPSSAAVDAIARTIAWKASIHGFDPRGRFTWRGHTYRNVSGHKDVGETDCPGLVYNYLPQIAAKAAALKGSVGNTGGSPQKPGTSRPPAGSGQGKTLGTSDALVVNSSGRLYAAAASGASSLNPPRLVDERTNWGEFRWVLSAGDMNRDGYADVMVVGRYTNNLFVYKGGPNGLGEPQQVGRNWGSFTQVIAPGDFDGDGRADLLATRSNGRLYLYPGRGDGGVDAGRVIGKGWTGIRQMVAVGDMTGDRRADLIGVTNSGRANLYPGTGRGTIARGMVSLGDVSQFSSFVGMKGAGRVLATRPNGTPVMLTRSGSALQQTSVNALGGTLMRG